MAATESAHTLAMSLEGIEPPIFRRVRIPSDLTLESVHHVIQHAMGWQDCHLHEFEISGEQYAPLDPDADIDVLDERAFTLEDVAPEGSTFRYTYDFGDGWDHKVDVEEVGPSDQPGPICLTAERACPPEDCGGSQGYAELLTILADPSHPDHRERLDWVGGPLDPEAVDIDGINRRLPKKKKR